MLNRGCTVPPNDQDEDDDDNAYRICNVIQIVIKRQSCLPHPKIYPSRKFQRNPSTSRSLHSSLIAYQLRNYDHNSSTTFRIIQLVS